MYENRLFLAFIYSHYIYYAIFAYVVFFLRIILKQITRQEIFLAIAFLGGIILEMLQLIFEGGKVANFMSMETMSFQRYFGCMAPLLWIWTGYGVFKLATFKAKFSFIAKITAFILVPFFVLYDGLSFFSDFYKNGYGEDALVAARRIAPIIKRDYAGEKRRQDIKYSIKEYYTSARPVVFSNFGIAAFFVDGQAEGPNHGIYPYPPDYIFLNMNCGGYLQGGNRFKPEDYDFVYETRGIRCRWVLFRRKGVPYRGIKR